MDLYQTLEEFDRLARECDLWPGFAPLTIPLAIPDGDRTYLIGHPSPPDGFHPVEPAWGRSVHAGPTPPSLSANTAQVVGGALCAVTFLEWASPRLLLHECFHVFQAQSMPAVPTAPFSQVGRYPESDPVNNALAIVENRLLVDAAGGNQAALAGCLAVRVARQARLDPEVAAYEAAQEYTEGTPTYIEVRAGQPLTELIESLAACNQGGKWAAYKRFYFTGALLALLLDRLRPGWQPEFARGGTTLQALALASAGPLPSAEQVLAQAGYDAILAAEREREAERQRQVAALLAGLESGPGVRLEVETGNLPNMSFDPTRILVVAPGIRLHTRWFCRNAGDVAKVEIHGVVLEDQTRRLVVARLSAAPTVTTEHPFQAEGPGFTARAPAGSLEPVGDGYRLKVST